MTNWGPFNVSGMNTIVTGGAMGIGFGIAARLVEGGANVLLVDLEEQALRAAGSKLTSGPGKVKTFRADIGELAAPRTIVRQCVDAFGSIDVLVNNAGIFPQVPVLEMAPELFDRVTRVNLRGLVFLSKEVGLQMVKQGRGGRFVNIASIDSVHPSMVGLAAYDASKGAVLMFTKSFALEMARHNVRVNAIAPGGIHTEGTSKPLQGSGLTEKQMAEVMENFVKTKVPLGRVGAPDDIAKVVVFLASSASDYMTGELIVVDGGTLLA